MLTSLELESLVIFQCNRSETDSFPCKARIVFKIFIEVSGVILQQKPIKLGSYSELLLGNDNTATWINVQVCILFVALIIRSPLLLSLNH